MIGLLLNYFLSFYLYYYCSLGMILFCLFFLGAEVDLSDKLGRTPLHYAASFVHHKCLKILLTQGCAVDKQDTNGCTPLHYACAKDEDAQYGIFIGFLQLKIRNFFICFALLFSLYIFLFVCLFVHSF